METQSIFQLITLLCGSVAKETKCKDINKISRSRSRAFSVLLQSSKSFLEMDLNVLRELEIHLFEMRLKAKNMLMRKNCDKMEELLETLIEEENVYLKTETVSNILSFLLKLKDTKNVTDFQDPFFSWLAEHSTSIRNSENIFTSDNPPVNPYVTKDRNNNCDDENFFTHPEICEFTLKTNPETSFFTNSNFFDEPAIILQNPIQDVIQLSKMNEISGLSIERVRAVKGITWDGLDNQNHWKEKPFVTECDSSLHLLAVISNSRGKQFVAKIMPVERLIDDIKLMLIGIRSESFTYSDSVVFELLENLTISTIGPETMKGILKEFMECGTCYKRLQKMSTKNPNNFKLIYDGFVFKALCSSIESFLEKFRNLVLATNEPTILSLSSRLTNKMRQITTLARVLGVHPDVNSTKCIPTGSEFLGFLYKEISQVTRKDISMLFVYILKQCCHIYFKIIQKWIFQGVLEDPSSELFIHFVDHYRENTKYFFDKAYLICRRSVPGFLQNYEEDILLCGKYVMLLKMFKPQHPLFSINTPSISVCLSFSQIKNLQNDCIKYLKEATEICGKPLTVNDIFVQRAEKKKEFFKQVAIRHQENFEQWKAEQAALAIEKSEVRQKQLLELRKQIKENEENRLAKKMANIEIEKEYLHEAEMFEEKLLIKENLERQKRIEHYKELNDIVESRKSHAEWKVNRLKLDEKRRLFLTEDENSWTKELEEFVPPPSPYSESVMMISQTSLEEVVDPSSAQTTIESVMMISQTSEVEPEVEVTNVNYDNEMNIVPLKKSNSDYFNANSDAMDDFHKNKLKVLGSDATNFWSDPTITNTLIESQIILNREISRDDNLNQILTEGQRNKIKGMSHEKNLEVGEWTDLSKNLKKVSSPLKSNLNLDLTGSDRRRNKNRNQNSQIDISTPDTPMSTCSEIGIDVDNGNVTEPLKLDTKKANEEKIPKRCGIPDTALLAKETPLSGLNNSEVVTKDGFKFPSEFKQTTDFFLNLPSSDSTDSILKNFEDKRSEVNFFELQRSENPLNDFLEEDKEKLTREELQSLNMTPLSHFLQKSITIPLHAHMEVINNEILKIYLEDLDIIGHFKSLRNYFFLMDGEFGSYVCDGLIRKLERGSRPPELLNYHTLHLILENALGSSIIGNDKNAERLSFIVDQMPEEKFDLNSANVLNMLSLSYEVSWPLNLILNPETIEQYTNVFKYLLKVRRISWVLEETFHDLKMVAKEHGRTILRSPQYNYVQQIRHKLSHFVHALQNHITSNALQAAWKVFKEDLKGSKTMEQLYRKHTHYVKKILFLCMLNKKSVEFYNTIEDIFKVVLKFYRHLQSKQWRKQKGDEHYTHPKFVKLIEDEKDFEKLIKYTIYLGNKIVRHGYQAEIGEFINLININNYYDNIITV